MKPLADQTLYEILEVRDDASVAEIQAACERALALYGPGSLATYTLLSPDEATLLAARIEEARATLLDPGSRARYDEALARPGGEARAAGANGVGAKGAGAPPPPFAALPPVIPAAAPPRAPPGEEAEDDGAEEIPQARPAILLAAVAAVGVPDGSEAPRPILLDRAVAAPPEPARAAAPEPPASAPPPAVPAPPDGVWTGEALRQVREARGISVQQIAERTKVTRHHIDNIEGDRFGALPAAVYLRGILLALARELRLDGQKVARAYLERVQAAKQR